MGIIAAVLSFFGCGQSGSAVPDTAVDPPQVEYFYFHYDGTIGRNNYSYEIEKDSANNFVLKYNALRLSKYGELYTTLDSAFMESISQLCSRYNIAKWDGFEGHNRSVSDGSGFSLDVRFDNGKSVDARGMNKFPNGYGDFKAEMNSIFESVTAAMEEKRRLEIVDQGIEGECSGILANFTQQGRSGSDKYEIFITSPDVREKNVDIKIKSVSGELIPPGNYTLYTTMTAEKIGFEYVTELVKKYNIISWYDYSLAAEDYNNEEWFQIGINFQNTNINAYGTKHPENYEKFRKELLEWVVAKVKEQN